MSTAAKTRIASAAFVVLAVWPIVHRVLVLRYDVNPWKLAGWSMYCVYEGRPQVALARAARAEDDEGTDGRSRAIPAAKGSDLWHRQERFKACVRVFGRLCSPEPLAAAALDDDRSLAEVLVVVRSTRLDRSTALIADKHHEWACSRVGGGAECAYSTPRTD